jgi:DNA-binding MarR family transcriptional regulator
VSRQRPARAILEAGAPAFREFLTALALHGQAAADAAGLGPTDFYALNLVGAFGPLTAGQLADRTGLTTGATTRLIDRLELAGYVRRSADPTDRRKVVIDLLPERLAPIHKAVEPAQHRLGEIFATYDPDQLDTLFDFFGRAAPALRDAANDVRRGASPRGDGERDAM